MNDEPDPEDTPDEDSTGEQNSPEPSSPEPSDLDEKPMDDWTDDDFIVAAKENLRRAESMLDDEGRELLRQLEAEDADLELYIEALGLFDEPVARPIPDSLQSDYSKAPFERCSSCNTELSATTIYQIEKVFQGRETVFEMAICYDCASDLGDEISEESSKVLKGFLRELLRHRYPEDCCQSCGGAPETLHRKSVNGMCRGSELLMPMVVVCEDCENGLQSSLSQQTRDSHDEFIRDNFPGVPAGLDLSPLRMV